LRMRAWDVVRRVYLRRADFDSGFVEMGRKWGGNGAEMGRKWEGENF